MPVTLRTWAGRSSFVYDGSVVNGTEIGYGENYRWRMTISRDKYKALLRHFKNRIVDIGTSRTNPPKSSLGAWLQNNVTMTATASYVGPILVHEGYARRVPEPSKIHIL